MQCTHAFVPNLPTFESAAKLRKMAKIAAFFLLLRLRHLLLQSFRLGRTRTKFYPFCATIKPFGVIKEPVSGNRRLSLPDQDSRVLLGEKLPNYSFVDPETCHDIKKRKTRPENAMMANSAEPENQILYDADL